MSDISTEKNNTNVSSISEETNNTDVDDTTMEKTGKKWPIVLALIALCAVIAIIPLMTIHDSEFGGADGAAEEVITEINPEYEPWAESLIELPGGETESLLFCLQAGIGGCVLGYGFGYYFARSKFKANTAAAA